MKREVILLLFLVICIPISYAEVVDIPGITKGESEAEQPRDGLGIKKFIYAGNSVVASVKDSNIEYYHQDRLSNRITTDSSGNKDKEFKSLPFGQKIENTGVDYPFTGKEEDESSLYYFAARYYDDNLGRFVSGDPYTGQGGNLAYAYVSNNPMNLVDPSGMLGEEEYKMGKGQPYPFGLDHLATMKLGYQLGGDAMKESLYATGFSEKWSEILGGAIGVGLGYGVEHWNENANEKSDPNSQDTEWDMALGYIGLAHAVLDDLLPDNFKTELVVYEQLGAPTPGGPEEIWLKLGFVPIQQRSQMMLIMGGQGESTIRPYLTYSVNKPDEYYVNNDRVAGVTGFSLGFIEHGLGVGYQVGWGDSGTHAAGVGLLYEKVFRHGNSFSFPLSIYADLQKGFKSRGFESGWEARLRPSIGAQYNFVP